MGKSQVNLSIQMYYALSLGFYFKVIHIFFKQHLFLQFWRQVVQIQGVCKAMLPLKFLWASSRSSGLLLALLFLGL